MAAMRRAAGVLALLGLASASATEGSGSVVSKVVELIEELKSKIEADGKMEQKMYNKYACWCETTSARKATDIHQAMADIKSLGSTILEKKGLIATRTSEIGELSVGMSDNQKAGDEATAMRQKESGEYSAEKAEMEQTLGALERAITVLSGAGTKTALLQMDRPKDALAVLGAAAAVHEAVSRLPDSHRLSRQQLSLLAEFTADPAEYYDQKAEKKASYSPASATIQGILKDMYDTFSMNLEKNTEEELTQQKNFENIMATKASEMATMTAARTKKEGEKADAEKLLADAQQDLDDTQKQMKADTELFDNTKKVCTSKAAEWNERVRARTEELSGINKALEILTSDDAKALFNKAIKPGKETFLQLSMDETAKSPIRRAYESLKRTATRSQSLRLAALAASVSASGHFDTVISAVDKMIEDLRKEAKDDRDRKDWCKEETFKNEQEASRYEYKIEKLDGKLGKLTGQLEEMESTLATTVASIQATMEDIEKMEDARKEAHATFESKKADDEGAVQLLGAAIESMSAFYKNNKIDIGPVQGSINLVQRAPAFEVSPDQAPDASFSSAGKSSGASKGIISTLTMIKEDCEDEIKNGEKEDVEDQVEFEEQVGAAKKLVDDLTAKKTNLESSISDTNDEIDATNVEKGDNQASLNAETEYLWSIKPDCTWLLGAFDDRRKKREIEIDGLQESKGMLQGAGAEGEAAFVQQKTPVFDDEAFGRVNFLGLRN